MSKLMDNLFEAFMVKDEKGYRGCNGFMDSRAVDVKRDSEGNVIALRIQFLLEKNKRVKPHMDVEFTDDGVKLLRLYDKSNFTSDDVISIAKAYAEIVRMYEFSKLYDQATK